MNAADDARRELVRRGQWQDQRLSVQVDDLSTNDGLVRVIGVSGDVDVDTAPLLQDALDGAVRDGAVAVVVDLGQLSFGDSSTLNALITVQREPVRLLVAGPLNIQVQRLFSLAGVEGFFDFTPDAATAITQLTGH